MLLLPLCACYAPVQTPPVAVASGAHAAAKGQDDVLLERGAAAYRRKSYQEAMTAFIQASAAGNVAASRHIGLMYLNGYGVARNAKRAAAEFAKAAAAGDTGAQYWLAYCYEHGIGLPQDEEAALAWYHAAAGGDDESSAAAMTAVGRLNEADDKAAAMVWYRRAAAAGDKEAANALREMGDD